MPNRDESYVVDILIHAYNHVDTDIVWNAATTVIPELIQKLEPLIPQEEEEEE